MRFYSTNNPPEAGKKIQLVDFRTALLRGLADDGGLYMPSSLGNFSAEGRSLSEGKFSIINFQFWKILKEFMDIPEGDLKKICSEAFNFEVPLVKLDKNLYILELFHGPTLSFKDFGARFMARAMNYYVSSKSKAQNPKLNIIVATSGDTGSAVANGFYGLSNIKVFVLYPSKRVSELQEKQIATLGKNIVALEVKGDFDDCQRLAKQALGDSELRKKINLSSANSINIGRLLPQMSYYFAGYRQYLGLRKTYGLAKTIELPVVVVPSGNFGNLTAGLFAKKLGLPVKKFIAGVNVNSGVPEFLESGYLAERKTEMTYSSAMDVGNPSNWARVMDLYKNSPELLKKDLEAITVSESETKKTITEIYKNYGYIADPHTAVGIAAAFKSKFVGPKIVLSTAHPAKFKEVVESAIGKKISLPKSLSAVARKQEKSILINKNYKELKKLIIDSSY